MLSQKFIKTVVGFPLFISSRNIQSRQSQLNLYNFIFKVENKYRFSGSSGKQDSAQNINNKSHKQTSENVPFNKSETTSTNNQKIKQQIHFTPEQDALIRSYKPNEKFNQVLNLDKDHNFQKEIIVARKKYNRATKQLRANILFEDLLKSQIDICVYDTKGKPYAHKLMQLFLATAFLCVTYWLHGIYAKKDIKTHIFFTKTTQGKLLNYTSYIIASIIFIRSILSYRIFQTRFVQKIIYNTEREEFTMVKRKIYGPRYNSIVSRYKLVYTQSEVLNKMGTNYFHLATLENFSITYKNAWLKQDLFSHLIAQRISI